MLRPARIGTQLSLGRGQAPAMTTAERATLLSQARDDLILARRMLSVDRRETADVLLARALASVSHAYLDATGL